MISQLCDLCGASRNATRNSFLPRVTLALPVVDGNDWMLAEMQSISPSENSSSIEFVDSQCAVGGAMSKPLVSRHSFLCAV